MTTQDPRDTSEDPLDTGDVGAILAPRLDDPTPVFMLNLLELHPDGGAEEYGRYGREMVPVLRAAGASIDVAGVVVETLEGDGTWDLILWVAQRSRRGFLDMVTSPAYATIGDLRTDALVRSELRAMTADPGLPGPGDGEVAGAVLAHELVEGEPAGAAALEAHGGRVERRAAVAETLIGPRTRWDVARVVSFPDRDAAARAYADASGGAARRDVRLLDPSAAWR